MDASVQNQNPPAIPYIGLINGGFRPGRLVRVQGRVNHNSHGFKIELLCGANPNQDDVALHFNPRFSESVVTRNSRNYSTWGTEERQGNGFPFVRGQIFEVLILCEQSHFKIAINGQHYTEFNHRVEVGKINYLAVDGDITISLVQFDGESDSSHQSSTASAPPEICASAPPLVMGNNYGDHSYQPSYLPPGQTPGFVPPYPTGNMGVPAYPPQSPYMQPTSYPQPQGPPSSYPPPSGYPPQGYPQPQQYGAYPPNQPNPGYYPQQYPYHQGSSSGGRGGGLMDNAGKLLAGAGLGALASKIPGMGGGHKSGHGYGHGYPNSGYPGGQGQGHHSGGGGFPGGALGGTVAGLGALGVGGALAAKVLKPKKMKKNKKLLKYGLPLAGAGIGGYALSKGMHGFRGRSSSSSSSSSD